MSASISLWIDELIERSSLGTPSARVLRSRTSDEEVATVDRLIGLLAAAPNSTRESGRRMHTESDETREPDRSEP